jgi:hypothetical protein
MAAREPKELWIVPGMGHAEAACGQDLVDRIGRWVDQATVPARPADDAEAPTREQPSAQTPTPPPNGPGLLVDGRFIDEVTMAAILPVDAAKP